MWMDHCISHFLPPTFFFFFSSKQYFYSYKKTKSYCRWFSKNSARSDFWFWSYLPYFQSWSWFKFFSCCFVLLPSTYRWVLFSFDNTIISKLVHCQSRYKTKKSSHTLFMAIFKVSGNDTAYKRSAWVAALLQLWTIVLWWFAVAKKEGH